MCTTYIITLILIPFSFTVVTYLHYIGNYAHMEYKCHKKLIFIRIWLK